MNQLVDIALPLALIFIMISLGLGLRVADFARVLTAPKAVLIGVASQMLVLPLTVFGLLHVFNLPAELAFGVMILAACPGGAPSNVLTRLANGDVALSITLTGLVSLLTVLTVPFLLAFSARYFLGGEADGINVASLALTMFLLTTLPVLGGMGIRGLAPAFAIRAEPMAYRIGLVAFVTIVLVAIYTNRAVVFLEFQTLAPIAITMVLILVAIGYGLATLAKLPPGQRRAISIETGIQNGSLGITLATLIAAATSAPNGDVSYILPAAVYGILMYPIIIAGILTFGRRAQKAHPS